MASEQRDNSKRSSGSCARCEKATTTNCGGCLGAPVYEQGPVTQTFYCSTSCQRSDWDRHKTACKALQARKSLYRAATILQAIMCRIRKTAYPLSVTAVRQESGKIILDGPGVEENSPHRLQPFPALLGDCPELLEAVLLRSSSAEAMVYLYGLAKELFDGLYSNLEEAELLLKDRKLHICTSVEAITPAEPSDCIHHVYKVTMKNEETWAVDITAAQYGFPECLRPWHMYKRECIKEINGQWNFGYFRHLPKSLGEPTTGLEVAKRDLAEALERQIPWWAIAYSGKLNIMMKGSEVAFQAAKQKLSDQVEANIQVSLAEVYSHAGVNMDTVVHEPGTGQPLPDNSVSTPPTGTLYSIKAVAGKGKGMVATSRIPKGTRILSEAPIFRVPKDVADRQVVERVVAKEIGRLSKDNYQSFFALHNIHGSSCSPALGIARTNALPLGPQAREGGLFLEASRINHSCRPNAQNSWNTNLDRITIHALRDIEQDEEVTITYLADLETYAKRQERLQDSFSFTCACELCSLPLAQRQQRDERLRRITSLDERIGDGLRIISTPVACLRDAHELLRLLGEEGAADSRIPRLYYDAFQVAIANGDQARARVFAQRAHAAWVILEGDDSPNAARMEEYAEKPAAHRLYGTTTKWKQAVTKVPQGLCEQEFEDWLWRKKGGAS